jgi:3-hydroxyacyl-CoA dehydrogenase
VNEIAASTSRPASVIGLHFFSPANVMRLVEVVRGRLTSPQVIVTSMAVVRKIGKLPVLVGVCDGFVGNRMVAQYAREAEFLLEEGATPEQVDGALKKFGLAMGRFAMSDLAGLDISWSSRKRQAATRPAHLRYSKVADRLCELGRFGQKTGAGFYKYEAGSRTPVPDPLVNDIIEQCAKEAGIERRAISDEEIVERCIYALVNEGAKVLEEGIAQRSSDIDLIYVNGYGFPAWRGGPMFYADTVGLSKVYERICEFHRQQGELWTPAPLLKRLVDRRQDAQGLRAGRGLTASSGGRERLLRRRLLRHRLLRRSRLLLRRRLVAVHRPVGHQQLHVDAVLRTGAEPVRNVAAGGHHDVGQLEVPRVDAYARTGDGQAVGHPVVDVEDRHRNRGEARHACAAADRVALAGGRARLRGRTPRGRSLSTPAVLTFEHLLQLPRLHIGHEDPAGSAEQHRHVLPGPGHRHQRRRRIDDLEHHPFVADGRVERDRFLGLLIDLEHHRTRDLADAQGAAHQPAQAGHLQRQAVLLVVHADQEARALERIDQAEGRGLGHPDALGDLLQRETEVIVVVGIEDANARPTARIMISFDGSSFEPWNYTASRSSCRVAKRRRCAAALPRNADSTNARLR